MPVKMQPTSVIKANLGIEPNGRVQKFESVYDIMKLFGKERIIKRIEKLEKNL